MFRKKPSASDIKALGEHIGHFIGLLKAAPIVAVLVRADGSALFTNPAAAELFKGLNVKLVGNKLPHFQPGSSTLQWKIETSRSPYIVEFNVSPLILDDQNLCFVTLKSDDIQETTQPRIDASFNNLFEKSTDGIVIGDQKLRIKKWNKGMERLTGYSAKEVHEMTLGELAKKISPNPKSPIEDRQIIMGNVGSLLSRLIHGGKYLENEMEIRDRFGVKRIVHYRMFPVIFEGKLFPAAEVRDVTEIKLAEESLRTSEIRFRALLDAMGEGAIAFDLNLNILFSNPVADSMYGAGPGYLLGKNIGDFIDKSLEDVVKSQFQNVFQGTSNRYTLDISDFHRKIHTIQITSSPWRDTKQEIKGSIIVFSDITEQKAEEDRLRFTSTHDEVTQLFNRNYYEEEKNRLIAGRRYPVSVVMADMDDFKGVNDTFGHGAGDLLLKDFGQITRRIFRGEDVVARIGGDEFIVLLPETDRLTVRAVVERLQEAVAQYNAENPEHKILFSVGTGTANSATELEDAVRRADNRMYREKKSKKQIDKEN